MVHTLIPWMGQGGRIVHAVHDNLATSPLTYRYQALAVEQFLTITILLRLRVQKWCKWLSKIEDNNHRLG